jgi:hypothetical protein
MVLATALVITDRDGVHRLSPHGPGHALGRDPMTLYRHAPNEAALRVAEIVLEHLKVDSTDPDWGHPAADCRVPQRASRDRRTP